MVLFFKKGSIWEIRKEVRKEYRERKQRQGKVTVSPVMCCMSEILGI